LFFDLTSIYPHGLILFPLPAHKLLGKRFEKLENPPLAGNRSTQPDLGFQNPIPPACLFVVIDFFEITDKFRISALSF